MFTKPDIYQATAVLTPAVDEKRPNPALGVLASFGVDIGSPSKVEDLETLFQSNDLTARVFRKYNLWPIVLPDRVDPATGKMKVCWTDRLSGREKGPRAPGDWDAIHAAKDRLNVNVNKKAGTVSVSFETPSAEGSANVVKYYLRRRKEPPPGGGSRSRGKEQAIHRGADREDRRCLDAGSSLRVIWAGSGTGDDGPEPGTVRVQGHRFSPNSGQKIETE